MTQLQLIVLLLKAFLITGFVSLTSWVAIYTKLAKWWRTPVGLTLVIETLLIAGLFIPTTLSLFFTINTYVAGWVDVALIGLVAPVMIWRSVVWIREALPSRRTPPGGSQMPAEPPDLSMEQGLHDGGSSRAQAARHPVLLGRLPRTPRTYQRPSLQRLRGIPPADPRHRPMRRRGTPGGLLRMFPG